MINRDELIWAAGLFDGEGHAGYKVGYPPYVQVTQSGNPYVLNRFHNAVLNISYIDGPRQPTGNRKPRWDYRAYTFEDFQAIMSMLWLFLSPIKKEQFKTAHQKYINYMKTHRSGGMENHTGLIIHECVCGRNIKGPSYYRHKKTCKNAT